MVLLDAHRFITLAALGLTLMCHGATAEIVDPTASRSTPLRETIRNKFQGVTISFLSLEFMGDYLKAKVEGFQNLTGATINNQWTTQSSWFRDIEEDVNGGGIIDLYSIFGNWIPTFADEDGFLDITDDIANQVGLDWFDIMPAVRQGVASYKGSTYAVPVDGDVIIMLYRTDLVEEKGLPTPNTWDDVLEIIKYYDVDENSDFTGDGVADYAVCVSTQAEDIAGTMFWAVASSLLQTQGTSQGTFFNPDTFDPRSSEPEFIEVLKLYDSLVQASPFRDYGPKGWGDNLEEFEKGRCALWINYPGPTRILVGNQKKNNMSGVLNYAPLPGKKCESSIECPHRTKDGVSHAPFLASGGVGLAVNKRAPILKQQAAIAFAFYISDPAVGYWDVAVSGSFLDPLRQRHTVALSNPESEESQAFLEYGWEERQLRMLKDVTEFNFLNDNYVKDLRILGANDYIEKGTVPHLIKMWNGQATPQETANAITNAWNEVTNTYGLSTQRDMYRDVNGLAPYVEVDSGSSSSLNIILPIVVVAGVVIIALVLLVFKQQRHIKYKTRDIANAPKKGTVALIFTDVEGSTALWDASKSVMAKALEIHHDVIRALIQKHKAYEVKTIGDSFMIATGSADDAICLANDIQVGLLEAEWPVQLASLPSSCVEFFPTFNNRLTHVKQNSTKSMNGERLAPRRMFSGLRVRIGVHLGKETDGEVEINYDQVTHGYDYYGHLPNAASRIEAMGFGGQTLISKEVVAQLSDRIKNQCVMNTIGQVELRGLSEYVKLFECLPNCLKGRRFHGVYRRRNSDGVSLSVDDETFDATVLSTADREADIMSLTPVQLQCAVARLRAKLQEYEKQAMKNAAATLTEESIHQCDSSLSDAGDE
eukprot:CAMPEP_0195307030 /NCGR_PEP_ID=MMETSP0707-20130614/37506_1 /TAXON_ID=33640 /ORGANISM="Asterionellopsis glacialis, Strain CCMP134" /LENGTH=877 /DNA_ID=CAMNT_0040371267 /DNA_START=157 /DNA_END=2790 /DNA_ORIENTATION=-